VASPIVLATDPPAYIADVERRRIRAAADRVRDVYPGCIGEYLRRELKTLEVIGLRFDQCGLTSRMIDTVLSAPLPEPPAIP